MPGEDDWTGQTMSLWWVLAGLGCVAIVALALSSQMDKQPVPKRIEEPVRTQFKDSLESVPIRELVETSQDLVPVVTGLLETVEEQSEEMARAVRGGEKTVRLMEDWHRRLPRSAPFNPELTMKMHAATLKGTGYLIMEGFRKDHTRMTAYFLQEDGRYVLDWQASVGYSEVLPAEVAELDGEDSLLMRVQAAPATFYAGPFTEEEYQCYSLSHLDPAVWVWGYARRSSLANVGLQMTVRARSLGGTDRRATIRVRKGPEGGRPNQVEVVDFLHVDWLSPVEEDDSGR